MKTNIPMSGLDFGATPTISLALLALALASSPVQSQIPPSVISEWKSTLGARVEAMDVLAGDYGITGGTYDAMNTPGRDVQLTLSKFGGAGDVGDPKPLGTTGIGWQPRLQGSMGYLENKTVFNTELLNQDVSKTYTYAIQFGGGARFWFNDCLSLAPTIMGQYGHTWNDYSAVSQFAKDNIQQAEQQGLVNGNIDTWSVIPAGNLQYVYTWHRTIFTVSTDYTFYHTESFHSSSSSFSINGNSESWENKLDFDIPLGKELFGHELRTGGYFSRTEYFDDLRTGLNTDHMYEIHPRIVLDFLGNLWKVQWIGLGGSYLWGNNFHGVAVGADIAFRF